MGVYDFLKGPCPDCREEIGLDSGDIQIKWFSYPEEGQCFRTFRPGDELPVSTGDGLSPLGEWRYCRCDTDKVLFARIEGGRFLGFVRGPTRAEIEREFREAHGIPEEFELRMGF